MKGILVNSDGDLKVNTTPVNGLLPGIEIGNNKADNIERVLHAAPGEFKGSPLIGANMKKILGGPFNNAFVSGRIMHHLKLAKIKIKSVKFEYGEIQIDYDN